MELPTESEVARAFGKQEILSICGQLEIQVDDAERIYTLVDLIWKDLDENGVPVAEDASDLLWEFLVFCRYYDEDGKIIEDAPLAEEDPTEQAAKISDDPDAPKCFGWGEPEHNPNCRRCPWKESCVELREVEMAKMSCAYVLYDPEHEECKSCTVWRTCKERMEAKKDE